MKNIIFVIQNESQGENFSAISRQLHVKFNKEFYVRGIYLDNFMGQNLYDRFKDELPGDLIPAKIKRPFYLESYYVRLLNVIRYKRHIKRLNLSADIIVIGNDGALQRATIEVIRPSSKKATCILLQEGILNSFISNKDKLKIFLQKILRLINLSSLAPSVNGCYPVNRIISFDRQWLNSPLVKSNSSDRRWRLMPRHLELIKHQKVSNRDKIDSIRILYATSAYKWHGKYAEHSMQIKEVRSLATWAKNHPKIVSRIRIRVHPRENYQDWVNLLRDFQVDITGSDVALKDDISWATHILSARSTVLVDALFANKTVCGTCIEFPFPKPLESIATYPITWINDWNEVISVNSRVNTETPACLTLEDIIAENTKDA